MGPGALKSSRVLRRVAERTRSGQGDGLVVAALRAHRALHEPSPWFTDGEWVDGFLEGEEVANKFHERVVAYLTEHRWSGVHWSCRLCIFRERP